MKHIETQYKDRISGICTDGFESSLLDSAFDNLQIKNPLRFNNFAYALRELLRHVLHRLSPDSEVSECEWFKPDPTSSTGFTRYQRIKYAIQGGLSDYYVNNKLDIEEVNDVIKELLDVIKTLSGYTHIEPNTFDLGDKEVEKLAIECLEATLWFVEKINEIRKEIFEALVGDIDRSLLERIISESVTEIMDLSSHQFIEYIYCDGGHVEKIGPKSLLLQVKGQIGCELQYGSGSDMRRGDGAIINSSFPFIGTLNVKFKAPLGSISEVDEFNVDTSGWYE